jgi:hypothetical protein
VIFQVYSLLFNLRKLLRLKILLFKKVNVILVMKSILKEEPVSMARAKDKVSPKETAKIPQNFS